MAARLCRALLAALALACVAGCGPADSDKHEAGQAVETGGKGAPDVGDAGKTSARAVPEANGFDFYVLSLSWSPSYCEAEGNHANRQQCGSSRSYAFVVHGLWPQFERGYPQKCDAGGQQVPEQSLRKLYDIMPSAGLIRHEWQTHGTCSGLSQNAYFDVVRAARGKVVIPQEFRRPEAYRSLDPQDVEAAFQRANPGLPADGIAVTCDQRLLREVRICLTKQLAFRRCGEVDQRSCRRRKVAMPPVSEG